MMKDYLTDEHFGELAAQVLASHWLTEHENTKDKYRLGGVDFSRIDTKRAARTADPDATSAEAEIIFTAVEQLIRNGATAEQKKLAVALGTVASRLPHGQRDNLIQKLIALAPWRQRASLLLNLVLSGEKIDITAVANGIDETLAAAQTHKWILTQSDGYELKVWLQLLPFVSDPNETLRVVRMLPPAQRAPRFLEQMIQCFVDVPSPETEDVFFRLAEEDPRFYSNFYWRTTAFQLGTPSSERKLVDLTTTGAFISDAGDDWQLIRELSSMLVESPDLRAHVYSLLQDGPSTPGLEMLAACVAESPDKDGLLLLVKFKNELKLDLVVPHTVEPVVTQRVPAEGWAGAYEVVPIAAHDLRQKLLALTSDGGPGDAAAGCLVLIDECRDKHGAPEAEPRHPDLASRKPWPILRAKH